MQQKGDKGIRKIEKEEKQLAHDLNLLEALTKQRDKKGKWR